MKIGSLKASRVIVVSVFDENELHKRNNALDKIGTWHSEPSDHYIKRGSQ